MAKKPLAFILQALNYVIFMALVWYFSMHPPYHYLEADQAVINLAFAHAGERLEECRTLSPEELAKLPPNMRLSLDCPRERSSITVELFLNDELAVREVAQAPGLYKDQGVDVFRRIKVPSGAHQLTVRMNDNERVEGPTHTHKQTVELKPAQLLVIDFKPERGKFVLK